MPNNNCFTYSIDFFEVKTYIAARLVAGENSMGSYQQHAKRVTLLGWIKFCEFELATCCV